MHTTPQWSQYLGILAYAGGAGLAVLWLGITIASIRTAAHKSVYEAWAVATIAAAAWMTSLAMLNSAAPWIPAIETHVANRIFAFIAVYAGWAASLLLLRYEWKRKPPITKERAKNDK